jgi:hypothetical protein
VDEGHTWGALNLKVAELEDDIVIVAHVANEKCAGPASGEERGLLGGVDCVGELAAYFPCCHDE